MGGRDHGNLTIWFLLLFIVEQGKEEMNSKWSQLKEIQVKQKLVINQLINQLINDWKKRNLFFIRIYLCGLL